MTHYTAFEGTQITAAGDMAAMIAAQRAAIVRGINLLIFDDATGQVRDVDLRDAPPPTRGRPKMGVKAREVTLLPRHWTWLSEQRGGASAALRRLVEDEMRRTAHQKDPKAARNAAYAFLSAIAGDLPHYEDALRHLFADKPDDFAAIATKWPNDIYRYAMRLAGWSDRVMAE
ncbi:DUF2239 family protein [Yoonia sp. 208BN28-4]|uniref:DUF2239 family protein n=1 Tax=Yoonia sp. 208BN28-4 TaxID=3126505 RepID=UPI0030AB72CC